MPKRRLFQNSPAPRNSACITTDLLLKEQSLNLKATWLSPARATTCSVMQPSGSQTSRKTLFKTLWLQNSSKPATSAAILPYSFPSRYHFPDDTATSGMKYSNPIATHTVHRRKWECDGKGSLVELNAPAQNELIYSKQSTLLQKKTKSSIALKDAQFNFFKWPKIYGLTGSVDLVLGWAMQQQ